MAAYGFNSDKSEKKGPKILLTNTTWWPTPARLASSLHRSGFTVYALCPPSGHPMQKTSAVAGCFAYRPLRPLRGLLDAIENIKPDLIIPCDDRATSHLHDLFHWAQERRLDQVRQVVERSLGNPQSYPIVSDRYRLLEFAARHGVRAPATIPAVKAADLREVKQFPCVLKTSGTWGGHGVRIAHGLPEAQEIFEKLMRPLTATRAVKRMAVNRDPFWLLPWWRQEKTRLIAQQFTPGRPANLSGLAWQGKVIAGIAVEALETQGGTGPATVVRTIEHPEMRQAAEKLIGALGISGFFGLDFVLDEESGAAHLIEMNPRCTQPCHLNLGPGRHAAGALWNQLAGKDQEKPVGAIESTVITYFPQAWHWNHHNPALRTTLHDVPWEERELVKDLLRMPYPDRGILARLANRLLHATYEHRAAQPVVPGQEKSRKPAEAPYNGLGHGISEL